MQRVWYVIDFRNNLLKRIHEFIKFTIASMYFIFEKYVEWNLLGLLIISLNYLKCAFIVVKFGIMTQNIGLLEIIKGNIL